MTVAETEALYDQALQSFGQIAEKSVNEANNNSRKRTFAEFQEFLSRNAYGVIVETFGTSLNCKFGTDKAARHGGYRAAQSSAPTAPVDTCWHLWMPVGTCRHLQPRP
jgi:hypothetical protein